MGEAWRGPANADKLNVLCQRRTHVESGNADVVMRDWRSRHIELQIDARTQSTVVVSQFMFPGWVVRDAQDPAVTYPIAVSPEGAGLMQINVPAGEHHILLRLEPLPSERWGAILSALSLCTLIGFVTRKRIARTVKKRV